MSHNVAQMELLDCEIKVRISSKMKADLKRLRRDQEEKDSAVVRRAIRAYIIMADAEAAAKPKSVEQS